MYACKVSLSAASMMCALVVAAASIALSRRRSAHFNENSSDVVASVVFSVASELLGSDFTSCEELLLLRLLLLQAFADVSNPLRELVYLLC